MKAIKHVLTERYYLWEDAYALASQDPEIDLSGDGEAHKPPYEELDNNYMVEEQVAAGPGEQKDGAATEAGLGPERGSEYTQADPSTLPANHKGGEQSQKL